MTINNRHAHLFNDDTHQTPHRQLPQHGVDIAELLSSRYKGVSVYLAVMMILVIGIIGTGIKIAEQTVQYRQDYQTLKNKEKALNQLQIEQQRLLIEQQTFSATPQIAARAVTELHMYSPQLSEKLIVQPVSLAGIPQVSVLQSMPNQSQDTGNKQGGQ